MSIKLIVKGDKLHHNDHFLLNGLDKPNQHPIEAIIGLVDELAKKYVKPLNGIPDSDLAERYITEARLTSEIVKLNSLYAKNEQEINTINENLTIMNTTLISDANDVRYIKSQYDIIKNMLDTFNLPSSPQANGPHIEQREFTADDTNKTFNIQIIDTDLKVIEPTIIKSDNSLAVLNVDYTISYPNDETLTITFINNGTYKINYIAGALTETEFNILLKYMNEIKHEISIGMAGSGAILKPACDVELIYDSYNRLIQEKYTGDVTKTIDYAYDSNNNIAKKTVTQGDVIKVATYLYNAEGKLINIEDNGTDIPVNGTAPRKYTLNITYTAFGKIEKEIYTGDINKEVEYTYNVYGDIVKKIITEGGVTKTATHIYDQNRKLIRIEDEGTESVAIVFPSDYKGGDSSGGTTTTDIGIISAPEIDLIFETIFKE